MNGQVCEVHWRQAYTGLRGKILMIQDRDVHAPRRERPQAQNIAQFLRRRFRKELRSLLETDDYKRLRWLNVALDPSMPHKASHCFN